MLELGTATVAVVIIVIIVAVVGSLDGNFRAPFSRITSQNIEVVRTAFLEGSSHSGGVNDDRSFFNVIVIFVASGGDIDRRSSNAGRV